MIAFVLGVVVFLIAGYLFGTQRDRIRKLATTVTLGTAAGSALPDLPTSAEKHPDHDAGSHPSDAHWDSTDVGGHTDSTSVEDLAANRPMWTAT
jgi:hypothetical protein